jgi:hypothetical protein
MHILISTSPPIIKFKTAYIATLRNCVIIHILERKLMSESGNLQSISNEDVKVIANFV